MIGVGASDLEPQTYRWDWGMPMGGPGVGSPRGIRYGTTLAHEYLDKRNITYVPMAEGWLYLAAVMDL